MPVIVGYDNTGARILAKTDEAHFSADKRKIFLVHLKVNKMAVTVYTTEEFAMEGGPAVQGDDAKSEHSDEMSDGGNEFSTL